jgi:very-short-patch-repair endonuclease
VIPSSHTFGKIAIQAANEQGWKVSNVGEAAVAQQLAALGYKPYDVETQFKLGPYRLDFALPAARVDIEADGWVHTARDTRARDRERDRTLKAWGWTVVRVSTDEEIRAQLRRHVPPRGEIEDYARTMRQVDAIFEAYLYRLQKLGVADPKAQLERMRDMLRSSYEALFPGRGQKVKPPAGRG